MSSASVRRRNWIIVGVFVIGLVAHIASVRLLVSYLGEMVAVWVIGFIQTFLTLVTVHYLAWLWHKNSPVLKWWDRDRNKTITVICIGVFWGAFVIHVVAWLKLPDFLDSTGWILFGISLIVIAVFFLRIRFWLVPAMKEEELFA